MRYWLDEGQPFPRSLRVVASNRSLSISLSTHSEKKEIDCIEEGGVLRDVQAVMKARLFQSWLDKLKTGPYEYKTAAPEPRDCPENWSKKDEITKEFTSHSSVAY